MTIRLLVCLFVVLAALVTDAAPRFARIFADHAVLQRNVENVVWGVGAVGGEALFVRFGNHRIAARVDRNGRWEVRLPAQDASREGQALELFADDQRVAVVRDVVLGEVWLAAGQSNMQFPVRGMVKGLPEARAWVDAATEPLIRFRRINDRVLKDRKAEARDLASADAWKVMTPESVPGFSAVAAVFAREVHEQLNVPIGIIDVSWGGKPIEPFIPREQFATPLLQRIRELADGNEPDELSKLRGGVIIRNPEGHPGAIFNARMAPVVPYGLRGFLWYQAESNAGRGEDPREYRHKMRALIEGWRQRWNDQQLPCYFVQLPSFPSATGWIRMREEQRRALEIPHTGMAVTIDVRGEGIHPPDKLSVGRRLARLALAWTYGRNRSSGSGPIYLNHRVEGSDIRVRFVHADKGLMVGGKAGVAPAQEVSDQALRWFDIAGADGVWHSAQARIEGSEVVVRAAAVRNPVAVRYACNTEPQGGNLYNRDGLPASPFCSDLKLLPWEDHQ